jgi:hypothetical protein
MKFLLSDVSTILVVDELLEYIVYCAFFHIKKLQRSNYILDHNDLCVKGRIKCLTDGQTDEPLYKLSV